MEIGAIVYGGGVRRPSDGIIESSILFITAPPKIVANEVSAASRP
jgi:hypothetical protein